MDIVWIIILVICAGVVPGIVAKGMGKNFLTWWIYGTFLLPIAVAHVFYLRVTEGSKACPYCHTMNRFKAAYCSKCGYEFIEF